MKKQNVSILISFIFALVLSIAISCSFIKQSNAVQDLNNYEDFESTYYMGTIYSVIDGDTIKVTFANIPEDCEQIETIRLIGVDTPELNLNKDKEPEYFAQEAKEYTNLQWRKIVYVQIDPNFPTRDKYGRLLGYVYLENDNLLNQLLIQNGYGKYYDAFEFNNDYMHLFEEAQKEAQINKLGIWNSH